MGKATVLRVDGKEELLDHRPTLKEAQQIVGGYIELLPVHGSRITLVLDEEGKLKGKLLNGKASLYFRPWLLVGDVIVLEGWKGPAK